jgi:ribulose-5-phosphate 4-epimerase/fuculose-1-phosphate aldolase
VSAPPGAAGDEVDEVADLRATIATACRILGVTGLAREITGHVSARLPGRDDAMLIRCRVDGEAGLAATGPDAVRVVDMATGAVSGPGADAPVELPIHTAVLRARADVAAVVHVHPRACVLCGLAGVPLRPLYGAYDHHATLLVENELPMFDSSLLVRDDDTALSLVAVLGDAPAVLMRGHGVTVVGASVEQAVLRAVRLEHLAEMTWELHCAGVHTQLPDDELRAFVPARDRPVLPRGERWAWNHYARLVGDASDH